MMDTSTIVTYAVKRTEMYPTRVAAILCESATQEQEN